MAFLVFLPLSHIPGSLLHNLKRWSTRLSYRPRETLWAALTSCPVNLTAAMTRPPLAYLQLGSSSVIVWPYQNKQPSKCRDPDVWKQRLAYGSSTPVSVTRTPVVILFFSSTNSMDVT